MVSNKTLHSFMKQLIEKVFENEYLDCKMKTEIDELQGFRIPKRVKPRELLFKASAMGFVTIEKIDEKYVYVQLTDKGKVYLESERDRNAVSAIDWMRYGITTLIALASLMISIYNLFN